MSISSYTEQRINHILKEAILNKLVSYKPETNSMPFHTRLLGKDRYSLFSFIQSMNTTFGISVWEPVAVCLAEGAGRKAGHQQKLVGEIDSEAEGLITKIVNDLRAGHRVVDKANECWEIKNSVKPANTRRTDDPDKVVDFKMDVGGVVHLFDITSAKPNMKEFVALKVKLLRWCGLMYSLGRESNEVFTGLAIPYNPYFPRAYDRWTLAGLYDLQHNEIMVGEEFWNYVANGDIYQELLDVFQNVGNELREAIDRKFAEFRI